MPLSVTDRKCQNSFRFIVTSMANLQLTPKRSHTELNFAPKS